jgi:hypothetical protein
MDCTPPRRSPSRRCHEPHHLTLTGPARPCDVRWLEHNSGAGVQDAMRSTPLFVSMALVPLFLCSSVFPQDGLSLFRKMQDALGGADRIAAIRDFEQDVHAESWNGNTGQSMGEVRKRTRWIRPNYLRIDQVGPGSTYVLYCDGAAGWEIPPGTQHVVELTGGELEFARRYVESFRLQTWIADRDPRYRITSPSQNLVRVSDGDIAHQLDITLDAASSLPVKISTITLADPAHPSPSDELTREWETVQGIHFPRRWTVFRSGVRVAEAKDARSIVNSGLELADLAAKPPDLKPVLSSR